MGKRRQSVIQKVTARPHWLAATSVVALLAGASPAWADNCFTASGNPFLVGFANGTFRQTHCGTENGFTIQSFGADGSSNLVFFMMGADTVNGNVILAQGSFLENRGISAAPPAVQAQIAAFNLGKGLPAIFPGALPGGLIITQSSIAGFVENAGTIDGGLVAPTGSGLPFAGERFAATNGILITRSVFSGPMAGITNSGLTELSSGAADFAQASKSGPFAITGITLNGSTLRGDITNSGTIMASAAAAANGVSAKGIVLGGGPDFGRPLAPMNFTGNIVNSGTLAISADGTGLTATGIEVDSAPGTIHAGIMNSGVLSVSGTNGASGVGIKASAPVTGGIANTGVLMVSVSGAKNGSNAKGIVLGGTASATTDVSGNIVNSGTLAITADGAGSSATGIELDSGQASAHAGIVNSGAISALGTNGASGVGIRASAPIVGGITNTGMLIGNTAAIDLTQETGGATSITQGGGLMAGNILGSGGDSLGLNGGVLALSATNRVTGLASFTQGPGGTLALQVTPSTAPGTFPTIHAGTISLGGALQVLPQGVLANYINGVTFKDVFSASTPITGRFASITTSIPLLTASVTPDTPDAFNLVLGLDRQALAGNAQDLTQSLRFGLDASRALIGTVQDRLVLGADYDGGLNLGAAPGVGVLQNPERGGVWARGYGVVGNASAGASPSYRTNAAGFIAGADFMLSENWRIGVAANYAASSLDFADAGHTNVSSYQGAIYTGWNSGPWYATAIAGFGVNSYGTTRQLAALGLPGSVTSNPNGQSYSSYAETGYRFLHTGFAISPYAGLGYVHTHIDGFTEDGGFGALTVNGASSESLSTDLGVRLTTSVSLAGVNPILPELRLGWRHEFLDAAQTLTASLAGLPGSNFSTTGTNFGRESAVIGLSATQALASSVRLFVAYDGEFSSKLDAHAFTAGIKGSF
jgi:uncharacterized protein with beta-barrel porin domain